MQTSGIGQAGGTGELSRTNRGMSAMKSEDFFRILTSELQHQDPFEPAKTADMVSQVAQIRDIELSGSLTSTLDSFAGAQRTSGVAQWIGKYVSARTTGPDGAPTDIGGVVTGVRISDDGKPVLELDSGQTVLAGDVTLVTTPENAQTAIASANAKAIQAAADTAAAQKAAAGSATAKPAEPPRKNFIQKLGDLLSV